MATPGPTRLTEALRHAREALAEYDAAGEPREVALHVRHSMETAIAHLEERVRLERFGTVLAAYAQRR